MKAEIKQSEQFSEPRAVIYTAEIAESGENEQENQRKTVGRQ